MPAATVQSWAGAVLLAVVCTSAVTTAFENLDTAWRIEQEDGFIMRNNTRCNGHYRVAGWNEDGPKECQEACDYDSTCASYSLELNGGKGCFLFTAEAACTLEEGWVSGHKDTRCVERSEGSVAHLKCPHGTLIADVTFASYGTPLGSCGSFKKGTCHSDASEDAVRDLCVGEAECSLSVSSQTLGDECDGTSKKLSVQITCTAGPEFNEDVYFNAWSSRSWSQSAAQIHARQVDWHKALAMTPAYPAAKFSGAGIIVVAGGKYLKPALVMIRLLRDAGCTLPIQVWHLGQEEMTDAHKALLAPFSVETRDFRNYVDDASLQPIQANVGLRLFQLKPLAILHSSFENVLLLDSDNCPLRDPSYLFDSPEFIKFGAVFWPDFWKTSTTNPIHTIIGEDKLAKDEWEQESGQLLINKRAGWKALNLCVHFNSAFYMHLLNGDKDTFRFAWKASSTPFFMVDSWPVSVGTIKELHTAQQGFCGHTMLQHDLLGQPLFVHHNQLKNAHLPLGENFKYKKTPDMTQPFRAVPVPGMDLVGGGNLACTDIAGTGLKNVDDDTGTVALANLERFEVDYMTAQAEVSSQFAQLSSLLAAPTEDEGAMGGLRGRRAPNENVTAACPLGQFELAVGPVQCETIADCSTNQDTQAPPTATSDRDCVNELAMVPTIFVKSQGGRVVLSVGGTYKHALLRLDTNNQYVFSLDEAFEGNFLILDSDDNVLTTGIENNGATAGQQVVLSGQAAALSYTDSLTGLTGNRITFTDSTYTKVYAGKTPRNSGPYQRFNTAYNPSVRVLTVSGVGLAGTTAFSNIRTQCKAQCDNEQSCRGIHLFQQTGGIAGIYCYGLSDLGVAMATEIESQSWSKSARMALK